MGEGEPKPFENAEVDKEGFETTLRIDYNDVPMVPSLEEDALCMAKTTEILVGNPNVTKIVFTQKHDYEYDYSQVRLLAEIAELYKDIVENKKLLKYAEMDKTHDGKRTMAGQYTELKNIIRNKLLQDPVGTYVTLKRRARNQNIAIDKEVEEAVKKSRRNYVDVVEKIIDMLEDTTIIDISQPYVAGHEPGDRDVYSNFFNATIKPDFMFTKIMASFPKNGEQVMNYSVGRTEVSIFKLRDNVQYLYHITPPEFKLDEEIYEILDAARGIMSEHRPDQEDFVNPKRMREVFKNIGSDLVRELADFKGVDIDKETVNLLTDILIRYSVGFGLIEVLLEDENVQDIVVNSPGGLSPIFLTHSKYDYCKTNIEPSPTDLESWGSKLRLMSGRPFDEANPILDTEIEIPGAATARVGAITEPLNPDGSAYAFRRHREDPWTLPLFIKVDMIPPLAAGLLSFIVDGNRTMMVAGTRSAGKSSFLGGILVEIMRKYRIITVEDTMELPTDSLRSLGFNIQPMKVASSMSTGTSEIEADTGIRSTLRLGDSALIVGEVRSKEAKALYEAMRVGALANVVAGTIHGDSPYGVYDRVVHDLEVPKTSFKATDFIIVANPIRSADGLHSYRRITQISEVRKDWEEDPLLENGFVDLMRYDSDTDQLEPTQELLNGDSDILKDIAGNVRDWAGDWDAVWNNIQLRAKCKNRLVEISEEEDNEDLLEAPFVIKSNDHFHKISNKIKDRHGTLDTEKIYFAWNEWLKKEVRRERNE